MSVSLDRLRPAGPKTATRSSYADVRFVNSDSIVGHGRRRKQAHDEHHDWIGIRRGRCIECGKTFTFLPVFSLPYTHYSLLARCQALLRRFVEHCSWEKRSAQAQGCGSRAGFFHAFAAGRRVWTVLSRHFRFFTRR